MAVYAIGDVQGCYAELRSLLQTIGFDPGADRLWFVGDLVNRGPASLEVLRFVRDLGEAAVTVLGNHDLHLLATATGARAPRPKDTFGAILTAPDRDGLLDWLRHRPLLHHDDGLGFLMVHAGLPPQWSAFDACARAAELEQTLGGPRWADFLAHMYGEQPDQWSDSLAGWDRLRFITNALTRMRYVDAGGRLDQSQSGPPGTQGAGLIPWFEASDRRSRGTRILFGHWATLQLEGPLDPRHEVFHLDSGCVWGGRLSAMRLNDLRGFSVPGLGA